MTKNNIQIIDVGCRYGPYPIFQPWLKYFEYFGLDADEREINRLKKVYENIDNLNFSSQFLSNHLGQTKFFLKHHKGLNTKFLKNSESMFANTAHSEALITVEEQVIDSNLSGLWLKEETSGPLIIKLDIEGSELDFLTAISSDVWQRVLAVIVEAHWDQVYQGASNIASILTFMFEHDFWALKYDSKIFQINPLSSGPNGIPIASDIVFAPSKSKLQNFGNQPIVEKLNIIRSLIVVGSRAYAVELLLQEKASFLNQMKPYDEFEDIKNVLTDDLLTLINTGSWYREWANSTYEHIFSEKLPERSDFYEKLR